MLIQDEGHFRSLSISAKQLDYSLLAEQLQKNYESK